MGLLCGGHKGELIITTPHKASPLIQWVDILWACPDTGRSKHGCACRKSRTGEEKAEGVWGGLLTLISYARQSPSPSNADGEEVSDGHRTLFPGNRYWPATDQSADFWWQKIMLFLFFHSASVLLTLPPSERCPTSTCLHLQLEVKEENGGVVFPHRLSTCSLTGTERKQTELNCEAQLELESRFLN